MRLLLAILVIVGGGLAQQQQQESNRAISTPEIGGNLPAQPVGPNDLIAVSVYDAPELSRTIRIGADGYFRLPMLKQRIKANGLTPAELETSITAALREEDIFVNPFVTVTIAPISQPSHQRGRCGENAIGIPGRESGDAARRPFHGRRVCAKTPAEKFWSAALSRVRTENKSCSPVASRCAG